MSEAVHRIEANLLTRSILKGHVKILHGDAIWKDQTFPDEYHLLDLLKKWSYDLKPAIKRGDLIEMKITFNKERE